MTAHQTLKPAARVVTIQAKKQHATGTKLPYPMTHRNGDKGEEAFGESSREHSQEQRDLHAPHLRVPQKLVHCNDRQWRAR